MNTYEYFSEQFKCNCKVSFNENGVLTGIMFDQHSCTSEDMKKDTIILPVFEKKFIDICAAAKKQINLILPDISFDRFWNSYNYKESGRKKAEEAWNKLKDADKVRALQYLPKYENHLKLRNIAKAYATTYLNQRRWEQ